MIMTKDAKSNAQVFGKSFIINICESVSVFSTRAIFFAFVVESRVCVKSSTGICSKLFRHSVRF